jgi:hypothetical protein
MQTTPKQSSAMKFVLMIGVLSLFADFTYEGSRSILGPYLAHMSVSATAVGIVTGFGELAGYSLRLVSGRLADLTGKFWPITIFGYVIQMLSVPALALVDSWPAAVAPMVPPQRRASAYGLFTAGYGLFWFLGSAVIGFLYDRSIPATITFCVALQLAAIPIFFVVRRQYGAFKNAS